MFLGNRVCLLENFFGQQLQWGRLVRIHIQISFCGTTKPFRSSITAAGPSEETAVEVPYSRTKPIPLDVDQWWHEHYARYLD